MPEPEVFQDRYEVVRTLSEGPRASVFQAVDRVHGRPVALKMYKLGPAPDEDFFSEAQVLMNMLPHRGVPTVRGDFFAEHPRRYVVVMNWVEGTNLQEVLDDDGDPGLPLVDVLDALQQVAEALDHLHGQDPPVVHGDVKPENIIRSSGGQVVLVDFEIAAHVSSRGDGIVDRLGTVGYVAPEVSAGEKPGPPADVFALAATAVTLLNGHNPLEAHPTYPGLAPAVQSQVARVLRTGIASDPTRRPRSATRLIANLRTAATASPPSGVVALLACEVAEAGRMWADDPESMRTAMGRLRDVLEHVVDESRGWVAAVMNEGDRTIAVFHEASAAAKAALGLHERLAAAALPPGLEIGLRVGLAVGEAELVDGVYVGAVVDQVVRLRAAAAHGTTVMSEPTAELLVGLVGPDVAIVPLGTIDLDGAPGTRAFALQRPTAPAQASSAPAWRDAVGAATVGVEDEVPEPDPIPSRPSARDLATDAGVAIQRSLVLVPATVAGIGAIYCALLAEELGFAGPVAGLAVLAGLLAVAVFAHDLVTAAQARRRDARAASQLSQRRSQRGKERHDLLERLIAAAPGADASLGADVLKQLGRELREVTKLVEDLPTSIVPGLLEAVPQLADDAYAHGIAAVTEAVALFEFAGGPHRARLDAELAEIDRHTEDPSLDGRELERYEQRRASLRGLAQEHDDARQRARDLLLEAERCATALGHTRLELASMRVDERPPLEQVVGPLEDSITRVRTVQDELRRLGY